MNFLSKKLIIKKIGLPIITITSIFLLSFNNAYAFGLSDIVDKVKDTIDTVYPIGKIIYEEGKEAYKVGKPYYRRGKLIARPAYDLYTGNYIGFIDSTGKLIKEF